MYKSAVFSLNLVGSMGTREGIGGMWEVEKSIEPNDSSYLPSCLRIKLKFDCTKC
jgi:hypothetical protein